MPLSLGSNERVLGELAMALGDLDAARGHFERAVVANSAGPSPTFTARSQARLVGCLVASGVPADDPELMDLIAAVTATCDRFDLPRVRTILEAELARR
jgi:hypothetical protein